MSLRDSIDQVDNILTWVGDHIVFWESWNGRSKTILLLLVLLSIGIFMAVKSFYNYYNRDYSFDPKKKKREIF